MNSIYLDQFKEVYADLVKLLFGDGINCYLPPEELLHWILLCIEIEHEHKLKEFIDHLLARIK